MNKSIFVYLLMYVVLVLAQVLICNHMVLFHVAVPIVFIYFIIRLPMSLSRNWLMTLSFLLGFTIDVFSDTLGVNTLACVLLASMKKNIFFLYVPSDDKTKVEQPSMSTLGVGSYCKFLLTMTAIYCFLTFGIEFFSFGEIKAIVIMSLASTALSFPLMLGIDSIFFTNLSFRRT